MNPAPIVSASTRQVSSSGSSQRRRRHYFLLGSVLVAGLLFAALLLTGGSGILRAAEPPRILYVSVNSPSAIDTGGCTLAEPCKTIQAAVREASPGDEVRVAAGTYTGSGTAAVVNITKTLSLRGGYSPHNWLVPDPATNLTVIHGGNARRGISIAMITHGERVTISGFEIRNCTGNYGAGIWNRNAELVLDQCSILHNVATSFGGGVLSGESGVAPLARLELRNTHFYSNQAPAGSALGVDSGSALLELSHFYGNVADYGTFGLADGVVHFRNNLVYNNVARQSGGGIYVQRGTLAVEHTTFYGNEATVSGGGVYVGAGTVGITNTIFASNTASSGGALAGSLTVAYSDFYANSPEAGCGTDENYCRDPQFVNAADGDFRLISTSPAIDSGTPLPGVIEDVDGRGRPYGDGWDRGAYEYMPESSCYVRIENGRVFTEVQDAVDAAVAGDVVQIAGRCSGVTGGEPQWQTVLVNKNLTLRGAYTVTDWQGARYWPTILDAEGGGRVLTISAGEVILENLHLTGGAAVDGAGVYVAPSAGPLTMRNTVVYGNTASGKGGGLYSGGATQAEFSVFYDNSAGGQGGGVYGAGAVVLRNSVVADNTATSGAGLSGDIAGAYNAYNNNLPDNYDAGVTVGLHNLFANPLFVDAANGDFHIQSGSPLIDAADPEADLAFDFEGKPRPSGDRSDIGVDELHSFAAVVITPGRRVVEEDIALLQGEIFTFTHTITNRGYTPTLTDTFDITITNSHGWTFTWAGNLDAITLDLHQSHLLEIYVEVPDDQPRGFYNTTSVTVTSRTSPQAFATAINSIANPGLLFAPDFEQSADPGEIILYTHVLTNIGPADFFLLQLNSSQGWATLLDAGPIALAHNESAPVRLEVRVPATAPDGLQDVSIVRVTSVDYGIEAFVTDTTIAKATVGTRYVRPGGQDTNNNCTVPAQACRTVSHAIQQAASGDAVLMAEGTYQMSSELQISNLVDLKAGYRYSDGNFVAVQTINPGATTLDFGGLSRGIRLTAIGAGGGPTFSGFRITNADTAGFGGAIRLDGAANAQLRNLIIDNSTAARGGALYVTSGTAEIDQVVITDVSAQIGGAIYNERGTINASRIRLSESRATVGAGGAFYNAPLGDMSLVNSMIYKNTAETSGGAIYNAGLFTSLNNTLVSNRAATLGGGLYDHNSVGLMVRNTLFAGNVAATGGGLYQTGSLLADADYNAFWENTADTDPQRNLLPGPHDVEADPLFVNAALDDYHLTPESPCLDVGDPGTLLVEDFDGDPRPSNHGYDIGADEVTGCLARVVNPGSLAQVGDIFYGLQPAVDFAPEGFLIQVSGTCFGVSPRTFGEEVISQTVFITKSLTIRGGYPATFNATPEEPTYLDALGQGRVLYVANPTAGAVSLTLSRLTLQAGRTGEGQHGAIIFNGEGVDLRLEDVRIAGGETGNGGHGGGLYNESGAQVTVDMTTFSSNAAGYGGALYNMGVTTMSRTLLTGNSATWLGGALYNDGGDLRIDAATVLDNEAWRGGGLYNTVVGDLLLTNSLVVSNTASQQGGGIYNLSTAIQARHTTFFGNQATQGAAIYHDAGSDASGSGATINSSLFVRNTASAGGAVFAYANATPAFDYNGVYDNSGGDYSPAFSAPPTTVVGQDPGFLSLDPQSPRFLRIASGSPMEDMADPSSPLLWDIDGKPRPSNAGFDIGANEVGDCYVRINGEEPTYGNVQRAIDLAQSGDVLYIAGTCLGTNAATVGTETVYQTAFVNKTLGFQGGYTVTNWTTPDPVLFKTTLDALGGGRVMYIADVPELTVTVEGLHLIGGNAAEGGGVYAANGVITMTRSHIHGNTADEGGGVYNAGAELTLDGIFLHGNTATRGGGLYVADGDTLLQNTFLYRNEAVEGAGVYNASAGVVVIRNNTFYGNAATRGGGLYTANDVPVVSNNLFAANTGQGHALYSASVTYTGADYSGVAEANGFHPTSVHGLNLITADPGFEDADQDDFRLRDDSPMLDQGDPATTLLHDFEGDLRPADQGFDLGADERRGCWARIVRGAEIFGPFGNPQFAIDLSEPGDRIEVTVGECRGVHSYTDGTGTFLQTVHITHNLHLQGGHTRDFTGLVGTPLSYPDAEKSTIFNAGAEGRALLIAHTTVVTVENVNLAKGDAAEGGAITTRGGAFYATSGQVIVLRSGFHESGAEEGGALAFGGERLLLDGVKVDANTATRGGGLFVHHGTVTVTGQSLLGHNAAVDGGALYVNGGTVHVGAGAKLHDNTATSRGGAAYVSNNAHASLTLSGAILSGNSAEYGGGVFGAPQSNLVVDLGTRLHSNSAQYGGAIYGGGSHFKVQNTLIYTNTAHQGAGIFVNLGGVVDHNDLVRNAAGAAGGGIYIDNSAGASRVRNNIFEDNQAPAGSAIYSGDAAAGLSHNNYWPSPADAQVTGVAAGTGNLNREPGYAAPLVWDNPALLDTLNFHLAQSSAMIDVGLEVGLQHDMDGHPRPINEFPDIGADEFPDCLAFVAPNGPVFGQIQAAVDSADAGGHVLVAAGICRELLVLDKDIAISGSYTTDFSGQDPELVTLVDAEGLGRVVTVLPGVEVLMDHITLTRGATEDQGAGIYIGDAAHLTLTEVLVSSCSAEGDGGGIYISPDARLTTSPEVWIVECSALGNGGGIYIAPQGTLDASELRMSFNNSAQGSGGAIYNAGLGFLSLGGSTFRENSAAGSGGAVFSGSNSIFEKLHNSSFHSNTAGQDGGAIYNASNGLTFENVGFWGNHALGDGGAVYNTGSDVKFVHNSIVRNTATGTGQGIYNTGTGARFTAGILANNGAAAGAIGIWTMENMALSHSLRWQDVLSGPFSLGDGNIEEDPLLKSSPYHLYPSYVSPAIDALDFTFESLEIDHVGNPRTGVTALCGKDMGYHEFTVGRRALTPVVPQGTELVPGQSYIYTVKLTNNSEEWHSLSDPASTQGPGSGYTETLRIALTGSQDGWSSIMSVNNVAHLTLDGAGRWAEFDLGPGQEAVILVSVTVPLGAPASVAGSPATWETTTLSYTTIDCREPLSGTLGVLRTTVATDLRCLIGPEQSGELLPGEMVSYTHVITNIGNLTTTYALASSPGFYATAVVSPTGLVEQSLEAVRLGPGESVTVTLWVTIRPEIAADLMNITTLIGRADGKAQCTVADRTLVLPTQGIRYVAPSGLDSLVDETAGGNPDDLADNNCTQPQTAPCGTLRHALDQAQPGEEVRVATGTFTAVYPVTTTGIYTQVLYITQPVTITGGYQASDWNASPPDHHLHASVLDAQFAGRVIHIDTSGPVHLSRLTLQDGSAMGQGGGLAEEDAGGSIYNAGADLSLDAVRITGGVAELGGGLYSTGGAITLTNNLLYDNGRNGAEVADAGGALYIESGRAYLLNNTLYRNAAQSGSAIYQESGFLTLRNNLIAEQVIGSAVYFEPPDGYLSTYNLWYSSVGTPHTGGTAVTGDYAIFADPQVVDPTLPNLRLLTGSPAREKGDPATTELQLPWGVDHDNEPRIMGSVVDIGAYEFVVEPSFELTPVYRSEAHAPGASLVYTHTLRNTGEFTGTFDLVWASSLGWVTSMLPPVDGVELIPGQSLELTFSGTVPEDSGGLIDRTVVTATLRQSRNAHRVAVNVTEAIFNPGVILEPATQSKTTDSGMAVTYALTLTNAGNGTDSFFLSVTELSGWTIAVVPETTPALAVGMTTTLTVTVTPPADAEGGVPHIITVTATSSFDSEVSDQAQLVTTVRRVPGLALAPDLQQTLTFEPSVTYTHTLTNTGNATEMITMTWESSMGWVGEFVQPELPVELGPGASIPVVFRLMVPPGSGGEVDVTTLTAGISGTEAQASVINITTVEAVSDFDLTPLVQSRNRPPGATVIFTHILTNTGNITDVYTVSLTSSDQPAWVTFAPESVTLPAGMASTLFVTVTVPLDAALEPVTTTIAVASQAAGTKSAQDILYVNTECAPGEIIGLTSDSPVVLGQVMHFTATVTGSSPLAYTWDFGGAGSSMAADTPMPTYLYDTIGSYTVTLTIANECDGPGDTMQHVVSVVAERIFGVTLTPHRTGSAAPGASVTYAHVLTNIGNAPDTFNLTYSAPADWTVTISPAAVQLEAQGSVPVSVVVRVPATALVGQQEVVTVTATSAGDFTKTDFVLDTTTVIEFQQFRIFLPVVMRQYAMPDPGPDPGPGPDLVVTSIRVSPVAPVVGQLVTVSVTVRNQGDVAVTYGNNFHVDLYVNQQPQPEIRGDRSWGAQGSWFGIGQSHTFEDTYVFAAPGSYTLWAQADTDNRVMESREDNNISLPLIVVVTGPARSGSGVSPTPEAVLGPRPTPTLVAP